jgi:RNA polymerase sigma factor (sigma-70 family)
LTIKLARPYRGRVSPVEAFGRSTQAQLVADLAHRYRPILSRFFQKRIRPGSDVDDLVQEVFARLARKGDLASVGQLEGYIFQVAANLIRERGRKLALQRNSLERVADGAGQEDLSPERILLGEESIARVFAALHELPERTRNAFLLHRFEDLKHAEIALRLGIAVSTVEKDIMRAMAHLLKRTR